MQINVDLDVERVFNAERVYSEHAIPELSVEVVIVAIYVVVVGVIKIIDNYAKGIKHCEKVDWFLVG